MMDKKKFAILAVLAAVLFAILVEAARPSSHLREALENRNG